MGEAEGEVMAKSRKHRTEGELQQVAKDVTYEIQMLIASASAAGPVCVSPLVYRLPESTRGMALESFLLHFRNLRAFLCPSLQTTGPDDVLASDFLGEPKPQDVGDSNKIRSDKQRLDRMLAHRSYSRKEYISTGNAAWAVGRMALGVLQEVEVFLGRIPEHMRSWFPERAVLAKEQTEIAGWVPAISATTIYPVVHRADSFLPHGGTELKQKQKGEK